MIFAECVKLNTRLGWLRNSFHIFVHVWIFKKNKDLIMASKKKPTIKVEGNWKISDFKDILKGTPGTEDISVIIGGNNPEIFKALGIQVITFPSIDPRTNGQLFVPPRETDTPESLFKPALNKCNIPALRFIRRNNPNEMLVYTDGCCLNNGKDNPRAGFSVVYRPEGGPAVLNGLQLLGTIKSRLERKGPDGTVAPQTSNRAELRAAIAALQFRVWTGEGFSRFVIATDSEYVVKGATEWVQKWKKNNWKTKQGTPAKNKDLWELLLKELDKWSERGMLVLFWHIPREQNTLADRLAKEAAELEDIEDFAKIDGVCC